MQLTLSEAISSLRVFSDQTHKFWGYYQAFTAAAIAFAWASTTQQSRVIIGLVFAYVLFALFNCRLVVGSQRASVAVWNAIQEYKARHLASITPEFLPILSLNQPEPPGQVRAMHVALSAGAACVMLSRLLFLKCAD